VTQRLSNGLVLFSLFCGVVVYADGLPTAVLARAYDQLSPTLVVVRYSSEVTNEMTGEVTKRENTIPGVIVAPDGLVLAQGHMIRENSEPYSIQVWVGHGEDVKKYDAVALKKPEDVNLVFLRIKTEQPRNFPYVRFLPRTSLGIGEELGILGLLGEPFDYSPLITTVRIGAILDKPRKTYCLDSPVTTGFVGTPAVNAQGEVVGVVGFDLSRNEGGELYTRSGHPLLYQSELFLKYIEHPPSERAPAGESQEAWLGIFTQPLTDDFVEYWHTPVDAGLIISTVVPNSPAAEVGLRPGDIITMFNGVPIRAKQDRDVLSFTKLVRETGAGSRVTVRFLRDGVEHEVEVTLGARPRSARDAEEYEDPIFGLTVREITADLRIALNLGDNVQGVIVRRVKSGSPAQLARIRPGVIILGIGNVPVNNLEQYKAIMQRITEQKPKQVSVFARIGTVTGFFRVEPRWDTEP
jgi:serine protease Do